MNEAPDDKARRDERDAVKRNMEKSTVKEPAEFRDEANESKRVEIGKDVTRNPIQGIDPET